MQPLPIHGRGSASNPANRFDGRELVPEDDLDPEEEELPRTRFIPDHARSVFSRNDSPDVSFDLGLNPYRGCEHGCAYCFARPTHEYLGFSPGLDFETRIMVKHDAPRLLEEALSAPSWSPKVIAMSGVTDPYQPAERRLGITRGCMEVLARFRNPVAVITKNHLVTRDVDALGELASVSAAVVCVSMTTLDPSLQRVMEPRTSTPARRLRTVETLARAGIPVRVMVAPVVPGLTDHELPGILQAAADAGAGYASYVVLRLPHGVADLFEDWLERHFPDRRTRVMERVRSMRGGKRYESTFGVRGRGSGVHADHLASLFDVSCRRAGLTVQGPELSTGAFRRVHERGQLTLFG